MNTMTIEFDEPLQWIAMDFPGSLQVELYYEDRLFHTTAILGVGGFGNFAGLFSLDAFDKVRLFNQIGGQASVDDLYFGPPIPAPEALALAAIAGALASRRWRRI